LNTVFRLLAAPETRKCGMDSECLQSLSWTGA